MTYGQLMGTIQYGSSAEVIVVPDALLAHLKLVMITRMRRSESFTLSWEQRVAGAPRHSTVWVHYSMPLRFTFDGAEAPELDPALLDALMVSSYTAAGIVLPNDAD